MVIKKEVTDDQYYSIANTINHFIHNPKNYKFDIPNMILAKTNLTFEHENKFFCSEFVGHVLEEAGIELPNTFEKMRPYQFSLLDNAEIIYRGELKDWCANESKKVLMK